MGFRKGTLTSANLSSEIEGDSQLANRLIKSYRDEWLKGASRFASLCYPYLVENENKNAKISGKLTTLLDTNNVGNDSSEYQMDFQKLTKMRLVK